MPHAAAYAANDAPALPEESSTTLVTPFSTSEEQHGCPAILERATRKRAFVFQEYRGGTAREVQHRRLWLAKADDSHGSEPRGIARNATRPVNETRGLRFCERCGERFTTFDTASVPSGID